MSEEATHPIPQTDLKKDYPAGVFPPPQERPPEYLVYLERAAATIKTIRMIVYAGMIGFLLLSGYGFFLVYELTVDAHQMVGYALSMDEQMQSMARIMGNMHESIADLRGDMREMRGDMKAMRGAMNNMDRSMTNLTANVYSMANTVALIQHSARNLDANFAPAGRMMNAFIPWGRSGVPAPPFAPPP